MVSLLAQPLAAVLGEANGPHAKALRRKVLIDHGRRNAETVNPYRPPEGDMQEDLTSKAKDGRPVFETRWQATRAGIWQGAVFGAKIAAVLYSICVGVFFLIVLFRGIPHGLVVNFWIIVVFRLVPAILITSFLFGIVPGGLIMGVIEMVRFRKPKPSEK